MAKYLTQAKYHTFDGNNCHASNINKHSQYNFLAVFIIELSFKISIYSKS